MRDKNYKLVLANGAFKSGSTWMRDIVKRMLSFEPIPDSYQHPVHEHWVEPKKIKNLVEDDSCGGPYLSKTHIYDKKIS